MDPRIGCEGSREAWVVVAMSSDRIGVDKGYILRSPHSRVIQVPDFSDLDGRTTDLEPSVAMKLGDGPKRIVNRGAGDGVCFYLDFVHSGPLNTTTHHHNLGGAHNLLSKAQKHADQRILRRRRKSDPSRDLN